MGKKEIKLSLLIDIVTFNSKESIKIQEFRSEFSKDSEYPVQYIYKSNSIY